MPAIYRLEIIVVYETEIEANSREEARKEAEIICAEPGEHPEAFTNVERIYVKYIERVHE